MPGQAVLRTTVVALAATLAVTGCGPSSTKSAESTATASPTGAAGDPTPAESAAPATDGATPSADSGSTGGGSTGGGTGSNGGQSGSKPKTSSPKATAPTIAFFRVAQRPSCPAGTSAKPIEGTPVVLEWKASNADSADLSVDGPGVYEDNLPPSSSKMLNFPCSGAEGDTQRHTYLLTVRNAQGKQTRSLVVTATVHDIPQV